MKRPPSDFELLKAICERHERDYEERRTGPERTGVAVPIDIPAIAESLGTNADSVAGRLYHHLNRVYSEERPADGSAPRPLFIRQGNGEANLINFPLLEAALAGLWQERNRQLWTVGLSLLSIGVAVAALIVSIVTA